MQKPIALVFIFDQLSPLSLPCYGNFFSQTPELNRLCGQGLIFHECYPRAIQLCDASASARQELISGFVENNKSTSGAFRFQFESSLLNEQDLTCIHADLVLGADESESCFWELLEEELSQQISEPEEEECKSSGTLICVSITTDETSGNALTNNEKLDWLEEILSELQSVWLESTAVDWMSDSVLLAVCSEQGESNPGFEESDSEPTPFTTSLSRENWAPLIVHASGLCGEFGRRSNLLSTAADLAELVKAWLKSRIQRPATEQETGSLFSKWLENFRSQESSPQRIILQHQEKLGFRTEEDLLVVAQQQLWSAFENRENQELADELELYLKPDDRFDVNDVAASHPELLQKRWDELLGNQPTQ